ncbi:MAG: hypothetical protein MEQ74_12025 [Paracoccus sp.]|nr:hypothetical protein [Paracoccus sp. (in: a-proteobacteria)]
MTTVTMPAVALVQIARDRDVFVPVIWASHREDAVDPEHPVPVADWDEPYSFKFDWPFDGGLTDPLDPAYFTLEAPTFDPVGTLLANPGGIGPAHGGLPIFVGGGGLIDCCTINRPGLLPNPGEGTPDPDLPPIAAVPLSGSGLLLASAFAVLPLAYIVRRILK